MREEEETINSPLPASMHDPVALINQLQSLLEGLSNQVGANQPSPPNSMPTGSSARAVISDQRSVEEEDGGGEESDEEDEEALMALIREKIASCALKLQGAGR